jgi:hypothetical protein
MNSPEITMLKNAGLNVRHRPKSGEIRIVNPVTGHWLITDATDEYFEDLANECARDFEAYWQVHIGQHIEA